MTKVINRNVFSNPKRLFPTCTCRIVFDRVAKRPSHVSISRSHSASFSTLRPIAYPRTSSSNNPSSKLKVRLRAAEDVNIEEPALQELNGSDPPESFIASTSGRPWYLQEAPVSAPIPQEVLPSPLLLTFLPH